MFEELKARLNGQTYDELNALLIDLESQRRTLDAMIAAVVSAVERSTGFQVDGHGNTRAWLRATLGVSARDAKRTARLAHVCDAHPVVGEALCDGSISCDAADLIAVVATKPRVSEHFTGEAAEMLVGFAQRFDHPNVCKLVNHWSAVVDPDGAEDAASRALARRHASVTIDPDGNAHVDAMIAGVEGIELHEIFERFKDIERDVDQRTADRLKDLTGNHVPWMRTNQERAADALVNIFRLAAHNADGRGVMRGDDPLVNIVVDEETFYDAINVSYNIARTTRTEPRERVVDGSDVQRRVCHTTNGNPVPSDQMLAGALRGHVRRVIVKDDGVILSMGRRQRLFTGPAREAVMLRNDRCAWPGCNTRLAQCEADHLTPFAQGGQTNVDDAAPLCPRHNRQKNMGYTLTPEPERGHWHVTRPDNETIPPSKPRPTFTIDDIKPDIATAMRARLDALVPRRQAASHPETMPESAA